MAEWLDVGLSACHCTCSFSYVCVDVAQRVMPEVSEWSPFAFDRVIGALVDVGVAVVAFFRLVMTCACNGSGVPGLFEVVFVGF